MPDPVRNVLSLGRCRKQVQVREAILLLWAEYLSPLLSLTNTLFLEGKDPIVFGRQRPLSHIP